MEKKSLKKNFEKKILITQIYHPNNQCDTIFGLLAILNWDTEKYRE